MFGIKKKQLSQVREFQICFSEKMIADLLYCYHDYDNDYKTIKKVSDFLNVDFSIVRAIHLKGK